MNDSTKDRIVWRAVPVFGLTLAAVLLAYAVARPTRTPQDALAAVSMQTPTPRPKTRQEALPASVRPAFDAGAPDAGPSMFPSVPSAGDRTPAADPAPLAAYVVAAMRTWVKEGAGTAPFEDVARDIAVVALSERPAFDGDESRARTALLLAAVADYEGAHYRDYVDRGMCNDPAWRATEKGRVTMLQGDCDGGIAHSLWQIHPEFGGLVLLDDDREWTHSWEAKGAVPILGRNLVEDRKLAARVALHMMRRSLRSHAGLCLFTGEQAPCPKGAQRLAHAESYSKRHPFAP
jgi:hypothetical protein